MQRSPWKWVMERRTEFESDMADEISFHLEVPWSTAPCGSRSRLRVPLPAGRGGTASEAGCVSSAGVAYQALCIRSWTAEDSRFQVCSSRSSCFLPSLVKA